MAGAGSEIRGELRDLELDIYKDASESFNHIINQYRTLYNKVGNDSAEDSGCTSTEVAW